jgi:hypothetical protein
MAVYLLSVLENSSGMLCRLTCHAPKFMRGADLGSPLKHTRSVHLKYNLAHIDGWGLNSLPLWAEDRCRSISVVIIP